MRSAGSFPAGASAAHAPPPAPHPPAYRGPLPACYPSTGADGALCSWGSRGAFSRRVAIAMAMDQVNALCEQLVKAVTVMMDPSSTQRYRLEALKVAGLWRPGPAPRPSPSPDVPAPPITLILSSPRGPWTSLLIPEELSLATLRASSHSQPSLLATPAPFPGHSGP